MAIPTYFRSEKILGTLTLTYLYKFILKLGKICFIKGRKQVKVTNYNRGGVKMQMLSDCLLFGIYVAIGAPDHSAMKKMSGKPSYGLLQRSLGGRYMPISAQK